MHVGTIWNHNEAPQKIAEFLMKQPQLPKDGWKWTGHWRSRDGTSFADFERFKIEVQISQVLRKCSVI